MDRRCTDPMRGLWPAGRAHRRGGRRLARRGHRALLDPRLGEPGVCGGGVRSRRREGPHPRGSARPRLLADVVPRGLGLRDAGADPALVLLPALHVGHAHGAGAVPKGPGLRENARRARPRDAQLVGEHDRCAGRVRAHGRRRHALAVRLPAPEPEPPLRLRSRARDPSPAAYSLELGALPRRLRQHRELGARAGAISPMARTETCSRSIAGSSRARTRWFGTRRRPTRAT